MVKNSFFCILFFSHTLLFALVPDRDTCQAYLDLEAITSCREQVPFNQEYLISYGHKYCQIFLKKGPRWPRRLAEWGAETRYCLQNELINNYLFLNCQGINAFAFKSHPKCYQEAGFCDLSLPEKLLIIKELRLSDVRQRSLEMVEQIQEISRICSRRF
jgi:hypothetical protein